MSLIDPLGKLRKQANEGRFPASLNFRDLGTLPTRSGLTLVTGRLYRSGDPAPWLNALGTLAHTIGLRTVIDLRTSAELKQAESGQQLPNCVHLHCPLFEFARPNWVNPADQSPQATATRNVEMLSEGIDSLVRIVEVLGKPEAQPVLIHCAAGRDRTGIVMACLLDLLGVTDEAIASDYALSDRLLDDCGRAHSQTILHFITLLRQRWGSTLQLLAAHGSREADLLRLPRLFMADSRSISLADGQVRSNESH